MRDDGERKYNYKLAVSLRAFRLIRKTEVRLCCLMCKRNFPCTLLIYTSLYIVFYLALSLLYVLALWISSIQLNMASCYPYLSYWVKFTNYKCLVYTLLLTKNVLDVSIISSAFSLLAASAKQLKLLIFKTISSEDKSSVCREPSCCRTCLGSVCTRCLSCFEVAFILWILWWWSPVFEGTAMRWSPTFFLHFCDEMFLLPQFTAAARLSNWFLSTLFGNICVL